MTHTDRTLCTKCWQRPRRDGQRWCTSCHTTYERENRRRYADLSPEEKIKNKARAHANVALRRGQLQRQSCETCGTTRAEMHHDDYAKPLQVRWLCRRHHLDEHSKNTLFHDQQQVKA